MAHTTVFAKNQTASPVFLSDIGVTILASGQFELSLYLYSYEIQASENLFTAVTDGDLLITLGTNDLTQAQSLAYLQPTAADVEIQHNYSATTDPLVTDDRDAGYSVGSVWINVNSNSIFTCVDDGSGIAIWQRDDAPELSDVFPASLGTAAPGISGEVSRADHVHAHGDLAGGTLHAEATTSVPGFMSAADKTALDGFVSDVFGNDYQYVESIPSAHTTSTNYQTKFSLVTPALTGTYRVQWCATVGLNDTSGDVFCQCWNVQDSDPVSGPFRHEPKDVDNEISVGGFELVVFTGASKTFSVQWKSGQSSDTARISNSRVEIWRVS